MGRTGLVGDWGNRPARLTTYLQAMVAVPPMKLMPVTKRRVSRRAPPCQDATTFATSASNLSSGFAASLRAGSARCLSMPCEE